MEPRAVIEKGETGRGTYTHTTTAMQDTATDRLDEILFRRCSVLLELWHTIVTQRIGCGAAGGSRFSSKCSTLKGK